jgi:hypothetical protein
MAITIEMRCAGHGEVENTELRCPHGCPPRFVVREFRTAPMINGEQTKHTDGTLRGLAESVGLTDLSNRDGSSVMSNQRRNTPKGLDFSPRWVDVPHASPGWSQRDERSPVVTPEQIGQPGLQGANVIDEFRKQGINLPGPTLAASERAGLLVGRASREELE